MEEITIREATLEDLGTILRIYKVAGIESEQSFTVEEARAQLDVFRQYPCFQVFVAQIQEEVVGTYELLIMDNLAKRGRKSGIVEDVAVSPEFQGRGVGRAMMRHAMRQCREAGCNKMVLSSGLPRTGAHEFYRSVGFEQHGISFRVTLE